MYIGMDRTRQEIEVNCEKCDTHIDVANDDRIAIAIEEIFPFWIATQNDGLSSLCAR